MAKNNNNKKGSYSNKGKQSSKGKYNNYNKEKGYESNNNSPKGHGNYNDYVGSQNDPRWYTHNQRLITDVTKIPFNSQIGSNLKIGDSTVSVPSVMTLDVITCPGVATSNADGVNMAGQAVFQKMRKDLSTYATYAQADVTMFIMQMVDIFTRYAYISRFFGVVNVYSSVNLTYSEALLRSMGLTHDAVEYFRENINDLRSQFNNLIYKAQSLYLPAAFPIVERFLWMFSNYFYDHDDPRAQIYLYRPAAFWLLEESDSQGTSMEASRVANEMRALLADFNTAIERIRNSDSMLKIMADMRRAFADVTPWKLSYIDENFVVLPTHSTEVLSQIENSVIMPREPDGDLSIKQSVMKNTVYFRPTWSSEYLSDTINSDTTAASYINASRDFFINMHWTNPSSDDIVVATRNIPTLEYYDVAEDGEVTESGIRLSSCGSDFITRATIWVVQDGDLSTFDIGYFMTVVPTFADLPGTDVDSKITPQNFATYLMFDWAPRAMMYDLTEGINGRYVFNSHALTPIVETDNYTVINKQLMSRIHNNVIMSMWNIPELGVTYN